MHGMTRVRARAIISFQSWEFGLEARRRPGRDSLAGLKRRIVNGLKRNPNPSRIQQVGLRQLGSDNGVMSNAAKLALIACNQIDV